jgi:methanogenic corrinoid protein MtbC1
MDGGLKTLSAQGLRQFQALQAEAVSAVTERFYATHNSAYQWSGVSGIEACREDLAFHLEFLRPVLEFGLLQPMVDYLGWLASVLGARGISAGHLALSLDWLAEFFSARLEASEAVVVAAALHAARTSFLEAGIIPAAPVAPAAWPEASEFEAALLAGKHHAAQTLVNRCIDAGKSLVAVEMHVIQPALYRIGEKWQANQVSVAQEHMASAIAQSVMTMGLLRSPPIRPIDKRVLLACVEGNSHAIGLRMVADAFQLAGWDVQYLGANVPSLALVSQTLDWKPDLIGLSVSFPQQLGTVKAVIAQLDQQLGGARPAVIVGGLAINRFRQLADVLGADASGVDALAALDCAREKLAA